MAGFLDTSAEALLDSEPFPAAMGLGAFPNVNMVPGPVLPDGLKLNVVLGLGDSLTLSPWPTLRPEKGPRESS